MAEPFYAPHQLAELQEGNCAVSFATRHTEALHRHQHRAADDRRAGGLADVGRELIFEIDCAGLSRTRLMRLKIKSSWASSLDGGCLGAAACAGNPVASLSSLVLRANQIIHLI